MKLPDYDQNIILDILNMTPHMFCHDLEYAKLDIKFLTIVIQKLETFQTIIEEELLRKM